MWILISTDFTSVYTDQKDLSVLDITKIKCGEDMYRLVLLYNPFQYFSE
jgi:hypothetical protein